MRSRTPAPAEAPARARFAGDDGSVIAEMALVAPLLVLLMLGVFEFGTAWRNKTILTSSLRSAARIESQGTLNPMIDQIALGALYSGNAKLTNMTLVKVIIYEATNPGGQPAANCLSAGSGGMTTKGRKNALGVQSCSIYSAGQVAAAATGGGTFGSCTNTASWDYNWCSGPSGVTDPRNNTFTSSGPDYVGIYAEYTYDTVTGLLPMSTITISDQAVFRIEPAV
ncbi:MAG: TadE/TadG family type IV pilus assembly protein [Acidimicrobiales bacterium]